MIMDDHKHRRRLGDTARVAAALCALAAGGGSAARAGSTAVTQPGQLTNPAQTAQYPTGVVPASFAVAAGSSTLTFTATKAVGGEGFRGAAVSAVNAAPQFTTAPYGAAGDIIEDTSFASNTAAGNTATGPLQIDFQQGVAGFGLLAQDFNQDTETFTLDVFNGAIQIGTFTFSAPNGDPATDPGNPLGRALFVGTQADGGDVITRATLSSLSAAVGQNPNNGDNDFAFGRAQVQAPVPEASAGADFGVGVLLSIGLVVGARGRQTGMGKRKGTGNGATGKA